MTSEGISDGQEWNANRILISKIHMITDVSRDLRASNFELETVAGIAFAAGARPPTPRAGHANASRSCVE